MSGLVVCAFDGSSGADKAFDYALTWAKAFGGRVHVLAVVQPPEPAEDVETEALLESGQEHFTQGFDALRKRAANIGVEVEFEVAVGHPAEQILYHADRLGASHIVLGHRGKNTFTRWLVGSVSKRVVSYAHCTVTVVR